MGFLFVKERGILVDCYLYIVKFLNNPYLLKI